MPELESDFGEETYQFSRTYSGQACYEYLRSVFRLASLFYKVKKLARIEARLCLGKEGGGTTLPGPPRVTGHYLTLSRPFTCQNLGETFHQHCLSTLCRSHQKNYWLGFERHI
ncbi:MAG: hypothetical protein HY326_13870 [Chloroflexi bacterium]|nr:hypothetical protein [Chloroflexota bacterium]